MQMYTMSVEASVAREVQPTIYRNLQWIIYTRHPPLLLQQQHHHCMPSRDFLTHALTRLHTGSPRMQSGWCTQPRSSTTVLKAECKRALHQSASICKCMCHDVELTYCTPVHPRRRAVLLLDLQGSLDWGPLAMTANTRHKGSKPSVS